MKKLYYTAIIILGVILLFAILYFSIPAQKGYPCTDASDAWAQQINYRHGTCSCIGIKKVDGFFSPNSYCFGIRTKCYVVSPNNTSSFIEENFGDAFTGEIKLYSDSPGAGKRYSISVKCDFFDNEIFK